jgi:hypothetical protein
VYLLEQKLLICAVVHFSRRDYSSVNLKHQMKVSGWPCNPPTLPEGNLLELDSATCGTKNKVIARVLFVKMLDPL